MSRMQDTFNRTRGRDRIETSSGRRFEIVRVTATGKVAVVEVFSKTLRSRETVMSLYRWDARVERCVAKGGRTY